MSNSLVGSRSEGVPRKGYFILGRDGTGAWQISGVVRMTALAVSFVFLFRCPCLSAGVLSFLKFVVFCLHNEVFSRTEYLGFYHKQK